MTDITSRALSIFRKGREVATTETPELRPASSGLDIFLSGPARVPAPVVAPARVIGRSQPARLVFAFDATASRSEAWETSKQLTDVLFTALPGQLDVALAAFGGGELHTFTPFLSDARKLRKVAAGVECISGRTMLLSILWRVLAADQCDVVVFIGDSFEESGSEAVRIADALKEKGTRVIFLFDRAWRDAVGVPSPATPSLHGFFDPAETVFADIAARTGGDVLPFNSSSVSKLRELLGAVAVLAVGGVELLEQQASPGATLLLEHLGISKRIGRRP
jgi:hypothetical protein